MSENLLNQIAKVIQDRSDAMELMGRILSYIAQADIVDRPLMDDWFSAYRFIETRKAGQLLNPNLSAADVDDPEFLFGIRIIVEYAERLSQTVRINGNSETMIEEMIVQARLNMQAVMWKLQELALWRAEGNPKQHQEIIKKLKIANSVEPGGSNVPRYLNDEQLAFWRNFIENCKSVFYFRVFMQNVNPELMLELFQIVNQIVVAVYGQVQINICDPALHHKLDSEGDLFCRYCGRKL